MAKITFTEAGEYSYLCSLHSNPGDIGMSGTIIVIHE